MGSWSSYGLGTENDDLPGFITICPSYQHGGVQNYSAAFLPAAYNGTSIGTTRMRTEEATINFLENQAMTTDVQRAELDLLQRWQRRQLDSTGPDLALEGRIDKYGYYTDTERPLRVALSAYGGYYTTADLEQFIGRALAEEDPYQFISRGGVPLPVTATPEPTP